MRVATLVTAATVAVTAQRSPVFHGGVDLVRVGVTVTDRKGELVADLEARDFEVVEDGKAQQVTYFAPGDPAGSELHLGLLLDVSGSMEDEIGFTRTASIKFLNTLLDARDVTLVDFDTEVRAARYAQSDHARLVERIRRQKVTGMTALYDAIGVYLDSAREQEGRSIMLLYTDGGDTRSALSLHELMDLLKASDVTVYAIGAFGQQSVSSRLQQRMLLQQIAETTGGQAFFPQDVKDLDRMYELVVAQVRAQYTIGYASTNERADGGWRRVDVRVRRPDRRQYRVRARKGYFAPRH